jgi:hypothetical protein
MDGRSSSNDDRDRLAEMERQLAELRAEVEELRREIQRLGDGTRERPSGEMQQGPAGDVPEIVLTVLVSAKRPSQGGQVSPALSGSAGELPGVRLTDMPLRSTVVVHAPAERLRGWDSHMPAPAPLQEQAERLLDGIRERLAERATETGLNPVWDAATARWYVTDFGGFERAAEVFGDLDNWGHQAVAAWVEDVDRAIDMPRAVAGDVGEVIGLAIPLPIDRPLIDASRVIQIAGVAFAAATGNMPLACASLKSLAHDRLVDFMAKGLLNAVTGRGNDRTSPGHGPDRASDGAWQPGLSGNGGTIVTTRQGTGRIGHLGCPREPSPSGNRSETKRANAHRLTTSRNGSPGAASPASDCSGVEPCDQSCDRATDAEIQLHMAPHGLRCRI